MPLTESIHAFEVSIRNWDESLKIRDNLGRSATSFFSKDMLPWSKVQGHLAGRLRVVNANPGWDQENYVKFFAVFY